MTTPSSYGSTNTEDVGSGLLDVCDQDDPCMNNSTCIPTDAGYTCHCLPGWKGTHCDIVSHYNTSCFLSITFQKLALLFNFFFKSFRDISIAQQKYQFLLNFSILELNFWDLLRVMFVIFYDFLAHCLKKIVNINRNGAWESSLMKLW